VRIQQRLSDDRDVVEVASKSKQLQEFWKRVAESYVSLEQGDPNKAHEQAIAAEKQSHDIDLNTSSYLLQRALALAEGLLLEMEESYHQAITRYNKLSNDDKMLTTRKNIAEVKLHIHNNNLEEALSQAVSEFGDDSLITNTVRVLSGHNLRSHGEYGSLHNNQLVRDVEHIECQLQMLLSLSESTNSSNNFLRDNARISLMNL
jgi:hypothetical protein